MQLGIEWLGRRSCTGASLRRMAGHQAPCPGAAAPARSRPLPPAPAFSAWSHAWYDDRVSGLRFRRNFGKAAALQAGFDRTAGGIVFTMDADLQDDPAEMPRFLQKLADNKTVSAKPGMVFDHDCSDQALFGRFGAADIGKHISQRL